jgi:ABC-2 type transport system ATP-binding protein
MGYIAINNYTKKIKKRTVLDNINLTFDKGKIYGLVGKNGCGKTMLLRGICGFITASQGEIIINNIKVGNGKFAPSFGTVIENTELYNNLTAFENLSLLSSFSKNRVDKEVINYWIKRFGLEPTSKKKYGEFSLGMRQRLSLAQAFMERPELIVLDEPTNALDEKGIKEFHEIALEAKNDGATIIIASHSKEDIDILCDKIFCMENGKITKEFEK